MVSMHDRNEEVARQRVGRLAIIAATMGLKKLEDVASEMGWLIANPASLREYSDEARSKGREVYAIAPDIVTLMMLTRDSVGRGLEEAYNWFPNLHVDAAKALAERPINAQTQGRPELK
jgi:hypothetical protein